MHQNGPLDAARPSHRGSTYLLKTKFNHIQKALRCTYVPLEMAPAGERTLRTGSIDCILKRAPIRIAALSVPNKAHSLPSEMELSSAVLKGLQAAGSTVISDQVYKSLATQAVQDSITPADSSELKSESPHFWNVYPDRGVLFVWDSFAMHRMAFTVD